AVNSFGAGTDGQKSMTAANDGLIRVISEDMQAAAGEDPGEDIARGRHTLTRRASNGDGEGVLHFQSSLHGRDGNAAMKPGPDALHGRSAQSALAGRTKPLRQK